MGFEIPVSDVIVQFAIVVTAALAVQLAFERTRVPGLVGLLVLGMLIGPGGLGVLPEEPVVELLGSVGLLFIMFVAGLEIDFPTVRHHKREAATFGVAAFALSMLPAMGIGLLIGLEWSGAVLLGAALSSHTLVAYPVAARLGLVGDRPVVAAIGGTLLTDTLALALLVLVLQAGGGALGGMLPLVLLVALAGAALLLLPRLAARVLDSGATPPEKTLFLLAALMLLSAAAEAIGTKDILGAFIAGVCLNAAVQGRPELHRHVQFAGRMLFIPFFFVQTGMQLELEVFGRLGTWSLAGLLLAVVAFGKTGAAWLTGRLSGYGMRHRAVMVGLTVPQAAATLAVVLTGRGIGLFDENVVDAVILVIFVTCLAGPLITDAAGRKLTRREKGGHDA